MFTEEQSKLVKNFLSQCGIEFENFSDLDGMIIHRETLLLETTYLKIKPLINDLKTIFSSSSHTSMQKVAFKKQRWPLINLVRQILRSCEYGLVPKRVSDGYETDGQKKYRRIFIISHMKKNNKIEKNNEIDEIDEEPEI
jgi:hypothetical protein